MRTVARATDSIWVFAGEGGLKAAGIAMIARDTGRVLMLQRHIASEDDDGEPDDNAGLWEFPGGKLEGARETSTETDELEDPLDGAVREWREEVGQRWPGGDVADHWDSSNGAYRGYIVLVSGEGQVDLASGRERTNPDDPDGDQSEQCAWWTIEHAKDNPALREEVKETPWDLLQKVVDEHCGENNRTASVRTPAEQLLWDLFSNQHEANAEEDALQREKTWEALGGHVGVLRGKGWFRGDDDLHPRDTAHLNDSDKREMAGQWTSPDLEWSIQHGEGRHYHEQDNTPGNWHLYRVSDGPYDPNREHESHHPTFSAAWAKYNELRGDS